MKIIKEGLYEKSSVKKLIEKTEREIANCRIEKNNMLMMDLMQKKYHYEQQIREIRWEP